jgi:transposase
MEAMTKHRSHSAAFKRQVAEELIGGETLHAVSKRHDISRQLIRIWLGKFEAGGLDDDVHAADLIQEYEAKIAALDGRPTGFADRATKGALKHTPRPKSASTSVVTGHAQPSYAAMISLKNCRSTMNVPRFSFTKRTNELDLPLQYGIVTRVG